MIWTYPISHFLEKHWYDSFLHLYQRAEAISWGKASGSLTHGKRSKPVKTGFEPPVGIEPTTCRLQGGRSGHLS